MHNILVRPVCFLLSALLVIQTAPRALAAQAGEPRLKIVILDGEGAINNIRQRTAREPIVQVQDENNRPVAGAVVVFLLPDRGASAVFPNGSQTMTAVTDNQGRAVARGLRPNNVSGQFQIRVTASFAGRTATATITQTNALTAAAAAGAGAGAGIGKLVAILAVVGGAAAAGGVYAATRGGGNGGNGGTTTPTPTTITPGTPVVSTPPR